MKATTLIIELSPEDRQWLHDLTAKFFHRLNEMSASLDALIAQVDATNGVMASAVVLIQGLGVQLADVQAQLAATGTTNAALDELVAKLNSGDDALQAALAANAPPVTPDPTPTPAP